MTVPGAGNERIPEDLDALLAAYALDAVTDDERADVDARLASSPELRDRVREHREAASALAVATEPVAPPPGMRASILDRLDEVPQVGPEADPRPVPAPAAPAPVTPAEAPAARAEPGPAERTARARWFARPGAVLAAAAAAVLLIAGAVVGVNWGGPAGWGAQRQVQAIADAPDARSETVASAGGGDVTLVWSEELGRSAVRAEDLPDVGSEATYELWYIDESGAAPAGTFDPAGGAAYIVLEGAFRPGVVVGMTVEPAGGSPAPTTEPVAVFAT
ncbi:anti-sigma factor domain-containing protein [Agromyces sp. SYSU T0242]|uniref:anti-sigma factor n=1 Tax=Agromyces litoreus TaxID=3158561 RepID=UPI003392A8A5